VGGKVVMAAVAALATVQGARVPEPSMISTLASLLVEHQDVDPVTYTS
jgi:hypothetical protein